MGETLPFLPYGRHLVEADDIAAVTEVLQGDWLATGPTVDAFEGALAARVGAAEAVACASGTAGLHLAATALDLGPGDAVIVPSQTFVATANAARLTGAEPVFADVDADTALMDAAHLDDAVARAEAAGLRPRAAFVVHMNGQCAPMAEIAARAAAHGLRVVEDAAHAIGAHEDDATPVGACRRSDMTVFSFHPLKTIAMGEGGAVTTQDAALAARLRRLRHHGIVREPADFANADLAFDPAGDPNPWYHEMPEVGFNYRASDIHCALGLSQLAKLDRFVARRAALAARYDALLAPMAPLLRPVGRVAVGRPAWHLYPVLIDFAAAPLDRAALMKGLRDRGIGSQVNYIPVHLQPYYRARGELAGGADLPGARAYYDRCLSLPLYPALSDADQDRVVAALGDLLGGAVA